MVTRIVLLWALSYGLHSTLLFLLSRITLTLPSGAFNKHKELVLRFALLGAIPISIIQSVFGVGLNLTALGSHNVTTKVAPQTAIPPVSDNFFSVFDTFMSSNITVGVVLVGWLATLLLLLARDFFGRRRFLVRIRPLMPGDTTEIRKALTDIQQALPRPLEISVAISNKLESPITVGGRNIYLPSQCLHDLNSFQLKCLFAHEVAHILRRDNLWKVIYKIVGAVFFFQPLNRILIRELNDVSEKLCDSWAAEVTGNRFELARCLVTVASWCTFPMHGLHFSGAVTKKSQLKQRIELLIAKQENTKPLNSRSFYAIFTAIIIAMVLLVPGFSLDNSKSDELVSELTTADAVVANELQQQPQQNQQTNKQRSQRMENRRGVAKTRMTGEQEVEVGVEQAVNVSAQQKVDVLRQNTLEVNEDINADVTQEVELDIKPVKPATSNTSTRPKNQGHTRRIKN